MSRRHTISPARAGIAGALALAVLISGCGADPNAGAQSTADSITDAATWFPLEIGGVAFRAQLAIRPSEQRRGLMFREELGEDDGMLFVYSEPQPMGFWMRDTPLPIDLGFLSPDGVLDEVHGLIPFDETVVRSRSDRVQFALEMNRGWFARNGVRRGDRLDLDRLAEAIRLRGFNPAVYLDDSDPGLTD